MKAGELLPELEGSLAEAASPMQFWLDVSAAFQMAYTPPRNDDLIRRTYAFADWCVQNSDDSRDAANHLFTCVAICFYEHIPMHPLSRADMPNWFTREEVEEMRGIFCYLYHLTEREFVEFLSQFSSEQQGRAGRGW